MDITPKSQIKKCKGPMLYDKNAMYYVLNKPSFFKYPEKLMIHKVC